MSTNTLEKLNRLRVNAGKTELKSWKASQAKLDDAIKALEEQGFDDVLPGADANAAPKIDDPEVAKARPEPEEAPSLADSAMAKNIDNSTKEPVKAKNDGRPALARGLDNEPYAKNCRERVRDHREKEKKDAKAKKVELSEADKKQIKDEAESRKPKKGKGKIAGEVDAKKEPEKAARQKKHVEDKQKARAEKPKAEKNPNEITVADIARELDIDPKVARAKLRRHEDKLTKLHSKGQDRWTFPKAAGAEIKKILQGKK